MSKQSTQADIQACVESFVTELTALIQKSTIESVLNAVSGTVGAPPARRGRPRKSASTAKPAAAPKAKRASTKKRGRRTSADATRMTTDALAHIAANEPWYNTGVDIMPHMPNREEVMERSVFADPEWWADNGAEIAERYTAWMATD